MEKESVRYYSKKYSFNRKGVIPFVIIILVIAIAVAGYFALKYNNQKEVMFSGNPDCASQGIGCECNDEIDNDGDGLVDVYGDDTCDNYPGNDDECPAGKALFRFSNYTNAHASIDTSTNFLPYSSCYPNTGYIAKTCTCDGGDCTGEQIPDNLIIRLHENENSHVEKKNSQIYPVNICLGYLRCNYSTNCADLEGSYTCVASIEPVDSSTPDTNMHVGNCSAYSEKICCTSLAKIIMNSTDNPDLLPQKLGIQILEDSTHEFTPANIRQGAVSFTWYMSINKAQFIQFAFENSPKTVSYKFGPADNIYNIRMDVSFEGGETRSYTLDQIETISTPVCGNGAREYNEECDDGNNESGDGCDSNCKIETGWICTRVYGNLSVCVQCGNDICEFPIENHRNCQADCLTYCSDGIIQTPNSEGIREQCDDQNNINGDGCNRNCQIESGWDCNNQPSFCTFCGDNEVEGNEQCDPPESTGSCSTTQGYQGTQTCNATCQWDACTTNQFCGDNIINGNEECDDGNVNSCDGCSGQCRGEYGFCGDGECCYDFPNSTTETPENCFTDCGVSSFLTGTKISISNNKEEKIENIKTEDLVLSFNEKTNFLTKSKVLQVFKHDADSYYVINGKIKVTAKHPIWTNGKWKKVSELKIGNALMTKDKIYQLIYSISYAEEKIKVYNLKVEDTQTYFAEGILVHNKPPIEIEPQPTTEIPNIGIEQQEGNIPQGKIVLGEGGEFGLSPPETHPIDKLITWAMNSIKELFGK